MTRLGVERLCLVLGALATLAARPVAAQSAAQRTELRHWLRDIDSADNSPAFDRLADRVDDGDAALKQLRRGLLVARRGVVHANRNEVERGLFDLDQAAARHSDWPWPEFAMARVFLQLDRGGFVEVGSEGKREGEWYQEALWRHLASALRQDATLPESRALALRILIAEGDRQLRSSEQAALSQLLTAPHREPDLWLITGRDLRNRAQYPEALRAFDSSLAGGGDASRLALERARTLRALGDSTAAVTAYWSGLAHPSAVGRRMYRTDLAWIVTTDSLADFDAAPDDSLLPFLHRFWAQRDMQSAKEPDGRLSEHLRRWTVAFANFRVIDPWRRTMFTRVEYGFEGFSPCVGNATSLYLGLAKLPPSDPDDIRKDEPVLDHRGLLYLRHGEPVRRLVQGHATGAASIRLVGIATAGFGPQYDPSQSQVDDEADSRAGTESWLYWIDGRWRVLFFRGSKAFGMSQGTTLTSYLPLSYENEWAAVGRMFGDYEAAALLVENYRGVLPKSCLPAVTEAIATSREDAKVGIATDSDSPPLTHPWRAVLNIFAVSGGPVAAPGRLLLTFALPPGQLRPVVHDGVRVGYDVQFRVSGYDQLSGRTFQLDTVRHFAAPAQAATLNRYISGFFELPIRAGRWDISVLARQQSDSAGAFASIRNRIVTDGSTLAISDIVTGVPKGQPLWQSGSGEFPLNALGTWPRGTPIELYYQVYGVPAGTEWRNTIEVRRVGDDRGKGVTVATNERSTGQASTVRRRVGLEQLGTGVYRLIVRVKSGDRTVISERPFVIVDP
ncbi:MAG: hypothetical protein V4503_09175 [Gemmatimonadota bacterium]